MIEGPVYCLQELSLFTGLSDMGFIIQHNNAPPAAFVRTGLTNTTFHQRAAAIQMSGTGCRTKLAPSSLQTSEYEQAHK